MNVLVPILIILISNKVFRRKETCITDIIHICYTCFCVFSNENAESFLSIKTRMKIFLIEKEFVNYFYDRITRKREEFDG